MVKLGNTTVRLIKEPSYGSSSIVWRAVENYGKANERNLGTISKHQRWMQNSSTKVYVYEAYDEISEAHLGEWNSKHEALMRLAKSLRLVNRNEQI